jgi:hypothetical protein
MLEILFYAPFIGTLAANLIGLVILTVVKLTALQAG